MKTNDDSKENLSHAKKEQVNYLPHDNDESLDSKA
jgi:hypothetical protein